MVTRELQGHLYLALDQSMKDAKRKFIIRLIINFLLALITLGVLIWGVLNHPLVTGIVVAVIIFVPLGSYVFQEMRPLFARRPKMNEKELIRINRVIKEIKANRKRIMNDKELKKREQQRGEQIGRLTDRLEEAKQIKRTISSGGRQMTEQ